jgi:hypothetical protein
VPADPDLLDLTAEIVAAHAAHSLVDIEQLPELIRSVYRTLAALASGQAPASGNQEQPGPAVPIRRSITPELPFPAAHFSGGQVIAEHRVPSSAGQRVRNADCGRLSGRRCHALRSATFRCRDNAISRARSRSGVTGRGSRSVADFAAIHDCL